MRLVEHTTGDWDAVRRNFRWQIPEHFNIAAAVCDRHAADPDRVALFYEDELGRRETYTFAAIQEQANRLGNALRGLGIERGDRIAILLPQRPETAIAHVAIYKLAAIALPLANLFGPEALYYRLDNAGVKVLITDGENLGKINAIRERLPALRHVIVVDEVRESEAIDYRRALEASSSELATETTRADDPALLIYTSGTTGPSKGALHAHRCLLGHLPGFELSHNFFPQPGDVGWTPADWAWIGGLVDLLLPCWYYGHPVLAYRARKFDPEQALAMMAKYGVRNAFLPPTSLKLLRQVPNIAARHKLNLRTIMSGGEALGAEVLHWAQTALGAPVNEIYGQTEVNYVIGNCSEVETPTPGSMGRPYPGHTVEVIDDVGQVLPPGELGEVAFLADGDPVFFLEYWNAPEATREKFRGPWAASGDLAVKDEQGRFWFKGRKDDVIISAGYRIGPTEIEEQLLRHPAVAMAAVIGVPDELRGEVVNAFVQLTPGRTPSTELSTEIQQFVRTHLSAHEYPRHVEFVESFPLTSTGKIMRRELRGR